MIHLPRRVQLRDLRAVLAGIRDAGERPTWARIEQDDAVLVPRTAQPSPGGRIRQRPHHAADDVHPLEIAVGEESDGLTVGRPERQHRSCRTRQRLRISCPAGECTKPELAPCLRGGHEGQLGPVRRDRKDARSPLTPAGFDLDALLDSFGRFASEVEREAREAATRRPRAVTASHTPPERRRVSAAAGSSPRSSRSSRASAMSCTRPVPVFLQTAAEQPTNAGRRVFRQRSPIGLQLQNRPENVGGGLASERRSSGQHLEQHAAERPDIRQSPGRSRSCLLGTHVGGCPQQHATRAAAGHRRRLRQVRLRRRRLEDLGQAEVEHLDPPFRCDVDVRRLQVAVNDALLVSGLERLGNLSGERGRFLDWNRSTHQARRERLTLDELQDEVPRRPNLLQVVDGPDVWMIQRREHFRLALKAGDAIGILRDGVRQALDGYFALEFHVSRAIDDAHAAGTEASRDLVGTDGRPGSDRHQQSTPPKTPAPRRPTIS